MRLNHISGWITDYITDLAHHLIVSTDLYLIMNHFHSRPDGGATLLQPSAIQDIGSRSTQILNTVQRFFGYHMIENYGCDYSSSGLTAESVGNKLKSFFEQRTLDGPRFDSYIVYYSGDVHPSGDWALSGKERNFQKRNSQKTTTVRARK